MRQPALGGADQILYLGVDCAQLGENFLRRDAAIMPHAGLCRIERGRRSERALLDAA
jgi:hypothetical protein